MANDTDVRIDPAAIERDLRQAIGHGELRLDFQPEFDLQTGRILAIEALVRWRHPVLGELGPTSFIQVAEQSDLIWAIGNWVIDNSLQAFAVWLGENPESQVHLRVNVSSVQLAGGDIAEPVSWALRTHGVPGVLVCVELTESAPIDDMADMAASLGRLRALGVTSAIDDLATGYSTLSNLRSLAFDVIKIDQSLVQGIDTDERARAIVSALIGLAKTLEVAIVAEGVESATEAQTLLELGCTRAQGHYLARPMNADAMGQLLREQASSITN